MADNQKYYYIRLKDNFFDSDSIALLESMQDGYLYCNILLKLYLRSLKDNGRLMFNDKIPYNPQMIATITKHQVGTVEKALNIFSDMGLIEILDNGAIYMLDIQNFIGTSTTEADRKRKSRSRIDQEIKQIGQMSDKSTPEIEKEIELELELDIKKNNIDELQEKIDGIIDYLNVKVGTKYKSSTKEYQRLIKALLKDYQIEDFKTVIDKKCDEWIGTKWESYLRPKTLFTASNFDGYLNQKVNKKDNLGLNEWSELLNG